MSLDNRAIPDDFEAPTEGESAEFDQLVAKVVEAMTSAGDPEHLVDRPEVIRRRIAWIMLDKGGIDYRSKK